MAASSLTDALAAWATRSSRAAARRAVRTAFLLGDILPPAELRLVTAPKSAPLLSKRRKGTVIGKQETSLQYCADK